MTDVSWRIEKCALNGEKRWNQNRQRWCRSTLDQASRHESLASSFTRSGGRACMNYTNLLHLNHLRAWHFPRLPLTLIITCILNATFTSADLAMDNQNVHNPSSRRTSALPNSSPRFVSITIAPKPKMTREPQCLILYQPGSLGRALWKRTPKLANQMLAAEKDLYSMALSNVNSTMRSLSRLMGWPQVFMQRPRHCKQAAERMDTGCMVRAACFAPA